MKKIILAITVISLFGFISCQKVKEPGNTSAVKVANEWWVTLDQGGTEDVYGIGHFLIATYNTSANDNTIWIDDYENGWDVKFKAQVDYKNLTFSASAAQNEYYNITVNQTDGKILPKMGHSKSGNVADSIHMKVEFSDDPGTIYEMNGVERTRFPQDDY
ncbi:MAG: lipid-binding protein [Ginsengibacter sp.]